MLRKRKQLVFKLGCFRCDDRAEQLTDVVMVSMLKQIAGALSYIETRGIVHRDLAARFGYAQIEVTRTNKTFLGNFPPKFSLALKLT